MRYRYSALLDLAAGVLLALLLAGIPVAAQSPSTPSKSTTPAVAKNNSPLRTPDGRPDLQGMWTNATFTPFERPVSLAAKAFFTEEEAAAYQQQRLNEEDSQPQDDIHYDNVIWLRERLPKVLSNRRTIARGRSAGWPHSPDDA